MGLQDFFHAIYEIATTAAARKATSRPTLTTEVDDDMPDVMQLEDRILFNVAPIPHDGMDGGGLEPVEQTPEYLDALLGEFNAAAAETPPELFSFETLLTDLAEEPEPQLYEAAAASIPGVSQELVFVDTAVEDYESFLNGVYQLDDPSRDIEIIFLSSHEDGLAQISDILRYRSGVDAIHLVSHSDGTGIQLGNTHLDLELARESAGKISAWGEALDTDADLLIYGCELASTIDGQGLIESLSVLCDCDVAASEDLTGHLALGGDWDLEFEVGEVDTQLAFHHEMLVGWYGVLDVTDNLEAHYTFDTDGSDETTPSYDGTLVSGATIDTDTATNQVGGGKISLDGVDQYVDVTTQVTTFQNITEGTLAGWVRTTGTDGVIYSASDSGDASRDITLMIDSAGQLNLKVFEVGVLLDVETTATVNDGTWHHVAATVGASGNALYIDGNLATVTYNTGNASTNSFFDDVADIDAAAIGRNQYSGGARWHFDGFIDDFRVYDIALTTLEVGELYDGYQNDAPTFDIPDFSTSHDITTSADGANSVTTADVDGDGDLDILASSRYGDQLAWYEKDGNQNFTKRTIINTAAGAVDVDVADVDGDGDLDILSASYDDDTIAWYENDGSQNFTERIITTFADGAWSVTTADVDGDGDLDVLSASENDDTIAWYENDGNQNFTEKIITNTADGATSVTTADVDGDGDLDVLSASYRDSTIAWYENDGNQNFTTRIITAAALLARDVDIADVDGDGDLDVLSASAGNDTIAWHENDGNQNFTARIITTSADGAWSVTTADVDEDGDLDVLSASKGDDTIAWHENDGSQNFTSHVITNTAYNVRDVHVANVDGDGDLDILSASHDSDTIAWYEQTQATTLNGNPTFVENGAAVVLDADVQLHDAELDALNGGNGNYSGASLTLVRNGGVNSDDVFSFNDGNGITLSGGDLVKNSQIIATFDTTTGGELVITFTDAGGEIPLSADVDNILRQITYSNSSDGPPASVQIDWTFDDGNTGTQGTGGALTALGSTTVNITAVNDAPTFDIPEFSNSHDITTTADGASSVITADVDGDGDLDVLSASWADDTIAWHENDGNENFTARTITNAADTALDVSVADMDGDGDLDVLSASRNDDTIAWYENDGSENFTKRVITTDADGARDVHVADVDGDGDLDVLSASYNDETIAWYENDGSQNFTARIISNTASPAYSVTTADMDGDGDLDVLSASTYGDRLAWYENDGNQNFTKRTVSNAVAGRDVHATDMDGDGDLDVVAVFENTIAWYENDGNQNFTQRSIANTINGGRSVTTADVDGDGDLDILSTSQDNDTIAWYENGGNQNFTERVITNTADGVGKVHVADLNGDGDLDILSNSQYDDTIAWFEHTPATTLDGNPTFYEYGPAVVLDADVQVRDDDLDALNGGNGNYSGASLTLVRNGGVNSDDVFAFNDGNGITLSGGDLIKNSQTIASFDTTTTAGELVITFTDAGGEIPLSADVDNILRQITYSNNSTTPPATGQIDWTFDDGNSGDQGTGGALSVLGSTTVNIVDVLTPTNAAPAFADLDDNPTFMEGGPTVVLDANVDITDADLDAHNGGLGNYSGSSLVLMRNGGASSDDVFSFQDGNGITQVGRHLIKNNQVVATFDTTTSKLLITFTDANGEIPLSVDVDNILRQITYSNSSNGPPANVQIDWTFDDGNIGAQGTGGALTAVGSTTVNITAVNDAPTFDIPEFSTAHDVTTTADGAHSVTTADVDGDGDLDILSASFNDYTIAWHENDGNENFTARIITTAADGARDAYVADVDGDGDLDVLSASAIDDTIAWYENDGSENFTKRVITTDADGARDVHVADVDGDGDLDTLSASRDDNTIAWYENDGSQNFTARIISNTASPAYSVTTADMDGDGDLDVLSASTYGDRLAWYENDGNQNFTKRTVSNAVGGRDVHATDMDGDGDLDVVTVFETTIAWHENDGNQNFTQRSIANTVSGGRSVTTADVDGDGDLDVLSASSTNDTIAWYENDGSQNFTERTIANTADNAQAVHVADVDGDGDLDVLSASYNDDTIAWYEQTQVSTLDGNPTFVEDGAAVVLDADVQVRDEELDALNDGLGNYSGASLVLTRNGGASSDDVFAFNDGNGITLSAGDLIKNSQTIASFDTTTTPGELVITFTDSNGEIPLSVDIDNILRQITYSNSSDTPPASVQLDWTFDDGNTGTQGTGGALTALGSTTVDITASNDAPVESTIEGANLDYTNGDGPVVMTATLALSDPDDTHLEAATIQITGNYQSGEDVLAFADQLGISGSWDAGTGTLSLSGSATIANYQTALRTLTYENTSGNPSPLTRTVSFAVNDGDTDSNTLTRDIDVTPNDPPVTSAIEGGNLAYTEEDGAVAITSTLTVSDSNDTHIESAVVQITGNYTNGEDALAFSDQLGISGSWDADTGTLSLSGSAPLADYQTALRAITYENTSDTPSTLTRTVSFTVNDGDADSNTLTRDIDVTAENDPPVESTIEGTNLSYTENDGAVAITSILAIGDPDDTHIESAVVQITGNYASGEDVLDFTDQLGITGSWNAGTGTLSLSGSATLANYETALQSITYENTSDDPSTLTRTVSFTVNDGDTDSNTLTRDIDLTAENDAPAESTIEGANLAYTENDGAVAITSTLAIADADDTNIESAVVQITGNYASGEDVLAFSDQLGITGSWNSGTGTLSLSGSTTLANYETALRSITYENTSDDPSTLTRTVSFTVNDGDTNSNTLTRNVDLVTTLNDAPVNVVPGSSVVAEETPTGIVGLSVSDVDAGANSITTRLQVSAGVLDVTLSGSASIGAGANHSNDLTLQGILADVNATLASLLYTGPTDMTGIGADALTITTNDGGNTGIGGPLQDVDTVQIDITAVNDAPVNTTPGPQTVNERVSTPILGITVSDVDVAAATITTRLQVAHGVLDITLAGSATISAGTNHSGDLTIQGSAADVNASLASLRYTSMDDVSGTGADTLLVTTHDGGNLGAGGVLQDVDGIQIDVNPVLPDDSEEQEQPPSNKAPTLEEPRSDNPENGRGFRTNSAQDETPPARGLPDVYALLQQEPPELELEDLRHQIVVFQKSTDSSFVRIRPDFSIKHLERIESHGSLRMQLEVGQLEVLLDAFKAAKENGLEQDPLAKFMAGAATSLCLGVSAGYVFWVIQGSHLIAIMTSTLPSWIGLDPIFYLMQSDCKKDRDKDRWFMDSLTKQPPRENPAPPNS